jgi:hypothetical protein
MLLVSEFSPRATTADLMRVLASYRATGLRLRWIDDTHAIAVLRSTRFGVEIAIRVAVALTIFGAQHKVRCIAFRATSCGCPRWRARWPAPQPAPVRPSVRASDCIGLTT